MPTRGRLWGCSNNGRATDSDGIAPTHGGGRISTTTSCATRATFGMRSCISPPIRCGQDWRATRGSTHTPARSILSRRSPAAREVLQPESQPLGCVPPPLAGHPERGSRGLEPAATRPSWSPPHRRPPHLARRCGRATALTAGPDDPIIYMSIQRRATGSTAGTLARPHRRPPGRSNG